MVRVRVRVRIRVGVHFLPRRVEKSIQLMHVMPAFFCWGKS
jgi:hypothetical protein